MYNKKFFDTLFDNSQCLFEEFNELVEKMYDKPKNENNEGKECEKQSSYYHFVKNEYENGKCVGHQEKIVDNGKVIKDENKTIYNKKEETKTIGSEILKTKNDEINKLKVENEKLKKENETLKAKIEQIKNIFNQ